MNIAKAIEQALANTIRAYGALSPDILVRAWQSLKLSPKWDENKDRYFPMVDVRCGPYRTDPNQATMSNDCAILCGSIASDDVSHEVISKLYDDVQTVIDRMYAQFRTGATGPELTFFNAEMTRIVGNPDHFTFGGLTIGEPRPPSDDSGVNMIGITLSVHYSRADF